MSISIIFPIDLSNPPLIGASGTIRSTSFGASSFSDQNPTEAVKQNLKMLLLTRPGEYVNEPDYGVGLPLYLFLQEQEVDIPVLESNIRSQSARWMPYMTIRNIDIALDPLVPSMSVRIEFFYNELEEPEVFELEFL